MKIAPTTVMADDDGVFDVVPLSRHRRCSLRHQARDAPGETLDLGLPDRTMMAFYRFPSWGPRFGVSAGWGDGGAVLHLTHRWRQISAAWRCGGSASDARRWTHAGGGSCQASW